MGHQAQGASDATEHALSMAKDASDIEHHETQLQALIASIGDQRCRRQIPTYRASGRATWYGEEAPKVATQAEGAQAALRQLVELQKEFDVHPSIIQHLIQQDGLMSVDDFRICHEGAHTASDFSKVVMQARR